MNYVWTCACCGERFDTLPLDVGVDAPDYWTEIPEAERGARGTLDRDFCAVDGHFFMRGVLELPIRDGDDSFGWGVWISLSEDSYARARELFDAAVPEDEPPRLGWFSNRLWGYPDTLDLKARAWFRNGGLRPAIELQPTDHPLAVEQREGITLKRVQEIVAPLLHRR